RFYWITPGRYYLNAGSAKGSVGLSPTSGNSPNEMGEEYEPAYYPGVNDMGQAAVIEVRPGDQMSAIDLTVNRRRSYRIRGRVIDAGTRRFPAIASISVTALSPTGLGNTLFSDPTQTYDSAKGERGWHSRFVQSGTGEYRVRVTDLPHDYYIKDA